MSGNKHHRSRDHFGSDLDTNVVIDGDVGSTVSGTTLHQLLLNLETETAGVTDHGDLTGLEDNDHPQYALAGDTFALPDGNDGDIVVLGGVDFVSAVDGGTGIPFSLEGGGSTIALGVRGDIIIPFNCEILEWILVGNTTGDIEIDLWADTLANFPPTIADSITASAKPTISSSNKGSSSTLTGWDPFLLKRDVLRVNVDSVSALSRVSGLLIVRRNAS